MSSSPYPIPERISEGRQSFLNCDAGHSNKPDDEGDLFVLNQLEEACSDSFLQIYYKYPDTGPNDDSTSVDVVALTPSYGCIVLNTLNLSISEVEQVRGPDWTISGVAQTIRPSIIAGDAGVGVRRLFEDVPDLRDENRQSLIPVNDYVVLPFISKEEWQSKFGSANTRILLRDDLEDRDVLQQRLSLDENPEIDDTDLRNALAALRFSDNISGGQLNIAVKPESKRELLDFIDRRLKILTSQQLEIGLQAPDAPQQIRGIAGSGKTVVSAFRAAYIHNKKPDFDIAVTFRTHGLHQIHRELITSFYQTFSNGDDPNWDKLNILHAWGGKHTGDGMYSTLADASDVPVRSANGAKNKFGKYVTIPELLNKCCKEVWESENTPELFDVIIIDEAQDLPEYFFQMCYKSATEEKRIYWAYDEAQNLATLEAQTAENLFGTDEAGNPLVDVSGNLPDQISATHVMRKSFRTPRSVLMTAYGFGMGLYRDGPVIQTITNRRGWDYLGYSVKSGDFRTPGSEVVVKRSIKNSPHPLWERQEPSELVRLNWSEDWESEIDWVVNDIKHLIEEENVLPDEILITYLWPYKLREERINYLESQLNSEVTVATDSSGAKTDTLTHNVNEAVKRGGNRANFSEPGKITLSTVHYVGGNEASIVYVMGTEFAGESATREQYTDGYWRRKHVEARNKAFIAMTRTKGWCRITGADPTHRIVGELNRVIKDTLSDEPQLRFTVPPQDSPYKNMEPEAYE